MYIRHTRRKTFWHERGPGWAQPPDPCSKELTNMHNTYIRFGRGGGEGWAPNTYDILVGDAWALGTRVGRPAGLAGPAGHRHGIDVDQRASWTLPSAWGLGTWVECVPCVPCVGKPRMNAHCIIALYLCNRIGKQSKARHSIACNYTSVRASYTESVYHTLYSIVPFQTSYTLIDCTEVRSKVEPSSRLTYMYM